MKKLKKEQVYVIIDNQPDCDRAIEILTKAGEKIWKDSTAFIFNEDDKFLAIDTDGEWLIDIAKIIDNRTKVTIDDLERIIEPKIKKSELLDRIEVQDKRIKQLEETLTNHLMSQITDINDEVTEIIIAEKPAFEVGNVYKDGLAMVYCTRIEDGKPFGFGFDFWGKWVEDNKYSWDSDTFTEATHEEWFSRLKEEAKKRYPKGTKMKCLQGWNEEPNSEWKDKAPSFHYEPHNRMLWAEKINYFYICVMNDGKWAEIIEEPQYQAGTLGAFWDGDFDFALSKRCVWLGKLENQTKSGQFVMQETNMCYQNFKPLKFD